MVASDRLIPQSESGDISSAADIVALRELVRKAADGRTQVVVLPEKSLAPRLPTNGTSVGAGILANREDVAVWLVVGLNQVGARPSAISRWSSNQRIGSYAKHHLIPSLEWDYKPGTKPAIFDAPWGGPPRCLFART